MTEKSIKKILEEIIGGFPDFKNLDVVYLYGGDDKLIRSVEEGLSEKTDKRVYVISSTLPYEAYVVDLSRFREFLS